MKFLDIALHIHRMYSSQGVYEYDYVLASDNSFYSRRSLQFSTERGNRQRTNKLANMR